MVGQQSRAGFTKLELVVVILILGSLMGLLLPSISCGPGPTRLIQCQNNLKQLGYALLAFEGRNRALPPGLPNCKTADLYQVEGSSTASCQGPNWQSQILSDIEEGQYQKELLLCMDDTTVKNVCNDCPPLTTSNVGTLTPRPLVCPAAEVAGSQFQFRKYGIPSGNDPRLKLSKGSYAACFGAEYYLSSHADPTLAGVFEVVKIDPPASYTSKRWLMAQDKGTRIRQVLDGTSKTVMVSEVLGVASDADARGVWTWPGMGGSTFTAYQTPNSPTPDVLPICETNPGFYQGAADPLFCAAEQRQNGNVHAAARSNHTGAVNVLLVDSSVHAISDNIDPKVWRALCTRAGAPLEQNPGIPE